MVAPRRFVRQIRRLLRGTGRVRSCGERRCRNLVFVSRDETALVGVETERAVATALRIDQSLSDMNAISAG
jgi:CBS domain-containing protein